MTLSTEIPTPTVTRPVTSLAVAILGFFVISLDAEIVNVTLSNIRESLAGGLSGLRWVVAGYMLTYSALMLFSPWVRELFGSPASPLPSPRRYQLSAPPTAGSATWPRESKRRAIVERVRY